MTTIINNPSKAQNSDTIQNIIMVTVVLLVIAGLFFLYVFPSLQGGEEVTTENSGLNIETNATLEETALSSGDSTLAE